MTERDLTVGEFEQMAEALGLGESTTTRLLRYVREHGTQALIDALLDPRGLHDGSHPDCAVCESMRRPA